MNLQTLVLEPVPTPIEGLSIDIPITQFTWEQLEAISTTEYDILSLALCFMNPPGYTPSEADRIQLKQAMNVGHIERIVVAGYRVNGIGQEAQALAKKPSG